MLHFKYHVNNCSFPIAYLTDLKFNCPEIRKIEKNLGSDVSS